MKECGTIFRQSLYDFPLSVELGKNIPDWKLSRWNGDNGLRFVPPADEAYSVRGNKRQLLYKGRQRSHRFTILGDGAFEYDCILLKEPESNVVSLRMEGAEQYDFLRQPDFVSDDFLKGSYAVYRKETLLGQGTGKLCHIHRPQIIDARGRKCWGELSVIGNELHITIPQDWLANAKYPVLVDPTVGTTTIGSQNKYDGDPLMMEVQIPVNRFLISEAINGLCTAYFYTNQDDYEGYGRPVFYSDNADKPLTRRSTNEQLIDLRVQSGKPVGWRSGTLTTNTNITSGSYIWFGMFCEYFWFPRFDYGMKCYTDDWCNFDSIPNTYPMYGANYFMNFKLSMYFTYTSAQNYVRTLTQSVRPTEARSIKADYRRVSTQTAGITETRKLTANYKRETTQNVGGTGTAKAMFSFFRQCLINAGNSTGLSRLPVFNRFITDSTNSITGINNKRDIIKNIDDTANSNDEKKVSLGFIRGIIDSIKGTDTNSYNFIFVRTVQDTQGVTETFKQYRDYVKCLYVEAGNIAETVRQGEYYRTESETVQVEGSALRQLFIFIKLVSASIVRDFILRRFLIAREELILKSKVTVELTLESKIN